MNEALYAVVLKCIQTLLIIFVFQHNGRPSY